MKLRWLAHLGGLDTAAVTGPQAVSGYLALSRLPGIGHTLDNRTSLLVSQLSAELSQCRWCIERGRHQWRQAGFTAELLQQLRNSSHSPLFTEREQAALALVDAMARAADDLAWQRARRFFGDSELAELTAIVAEHHCLDSPIASHFEP